MKIFCINYVIHNSNYVKNKIYYIIMWYMVLIFKLNRFTFTQRSSTFRVLCLLWRFKAIKKCS